MHFMHMHKKQTGRIYVFIICPSSLYTAYPSGSQGSQSQLTSGERWGAGWAGHQSITALLDFFFFVKCNFFLPQFHLTASANIFYVTHPSLFYSPFNTCISDISDISNLSFFFLSISPVCS